MPRDMGHRLAPNSPKQELLAVPHLLRAHWHVRKKNKLLLGQLQDMAQKDFTIETRCLYARFDQTLGILTDYRLYRDGGSASCYRGLTFHLALAAFPSLLTPELGSV